MYPHSNRSVCHCERVWQLGGGAKTLFGYTLHRTGRSCTPYCPFIHRLTQFGTPRRSYSVASHEIFSVSEAHDRFLLAFRIHICICERVFTCFNHICGHFRSAKRFLVKKIVNQHVETRSICEKLLIFASISTSGIHCNIVALFDHLPSAYAPFSTIFANVNAKFSGMNLFQITSDISFVNFFVCSFTSLNYLHENAFIIGA